MATASWLVVLRASAVVCNVRPGVSATKTELIPVLAVSSL